MLYEDNDSLVHFGILGQKWGVRRFQNPDGTLTEEGKKRYSQTVETAKRILSDAHADHREEAEGWARDFKEKKEYFDKHPTTSKNEQEKYIKSQFGNTWKEDLDHIKKLLK